MEKHFIDQAEMEQLHYMGYLLSLSFRHSAKEIAAEQRKLKKARKQEEKRKKRSKKLYELYQEAGSIRKVCEISGLCYSTVQRAIKEVKEL